LQAVKDIKLAILQARARAARASNAEALKLYFFVGGYISKKTRSAKWGTGAINALSERLQVELPGLRGFSASSIKSMRIFYEVWSSEFALEVAEKNRYSSINEIRQLSSAEMRDVSICPTAIGESALMPIRQMAFAEFGIDAFTAFLSVGFSSHRAILAKTDDKEEIWYYILSCAKNQWTYIELERHLRADDYHHVGALPNNFERALPMVQATRAVRSFRDEYLLELVNLDNVDAVRDQDVDERVLSKSLVADVEKTIAALGGSDFCFMGREKRLMVEGEEVFVDLLFYHRTLQAMVAIELKMGKFRASYLGQLSLYLSALDKYEKKPNEKPTIGILLCEEMNKPFVQLAVQDISKPIGIATYKTIKSIPKPYRALAPVIDGVRKALSEAKGNFK